jgi:hypothetical protein
MRWNLAWIGWHSPSSLGATLWCTTQRPSAGRQHLLRALLDEKTAVHEGITFERATKNGALYTQRSLDFIDCINNTPSKKMLR